MSGGLSNSYRPRNAGHDYYGRGTYLITLVVSGREQLLSSLTATGIDALKNGRALTLTPLGEVVEQAWLRTPEAQAAHGNRSMHRAFPLIHLQKEPIGAFWKPERQRFDACANGSLLILAPWNLDQMGSVRGVPSDTDYSRFHNLNALAAEICAFNGEARILRDVYSD